MEYQRSRGMFLRFGIAGQPLSHGPIVLRSPVRERSAHGGRVLWATGCDAHAGTRRVPTVVSTSSHASSSQIWPFRLQIWTKGVLVEHRAPVVGRCNVCPVSFKNRLDTTRSQNVSRDMYDWRRKKDGHIWRYSATWSRFVAHIGASCNKLRARSFQIMETSICLPWVTCKLSVMH